MMRLRRLLIATLVIALAAPVAMAAPEGVPDVLPFAGDAVPTGSITTVRVADVAPTPKTVDADPSDWTGEPTRLGGTTVLSSGELVYSDYVFDAHGADDGADARRRAVLGPVVEAESRTYRFRDALSQAAGSQFGVDEPKEVGAPEHFGDATTPDGRREAADLVELRFAADDEQLFVLARTGAMRDAEDTALLLLLHEGDGPAWEVPFNAHLTTTASAAVLLSARGGRIAYPDGTVIDAGATVAVDPAGFTNAIEASMPIPTAAEVSAATGYLDHATGDLLDVATGDAEANVVNVAFRAEPPAVWMDDRQAFALLDGSIDAFRAPLDVAALAAGVMEAWAPNPGYHERVFVSSDAVSTEDRSEQGRFQHYGLYIPTRYEHGATNPLTFWLHWRGGNAHQAAAWTPRSIMRLGEERGNVVVSVSARGTSTWYRGRGHADFLEALADAEAWGRDPDRTYVAGYSMGGYGSYLLPALYPDLFAGAFPTVGVPLPSSWGPLIENARHVPYAVFVGAADELVPYPATLPWWQKMYDLGFEGRFYTFPHEHYTTALIDEWDEGTRYLGDRVRTNPAHVRFHRIPAVEAAVGEGVIEVKADKAYWVSEVEVREGDPSSFATMATVDARTDGVGHTPQLALPEAGVAAPGHTTPYVMWGRDYVDDPLASPTPPAPTFGAELSNVAQVRFDLARMGFGSGVVTAEVATDGDTVLRLDGGFTSTPVIVIDGALAAVTLDDGVASVSLGAGKHVLSIQL